MFIDTAPYIAPIATALVSIANTLLIIYVNRHLGKVAKSVDGVKTELVNATAKASTLKGHASGVVAGIAMEKKSAKDIRDTLNKKK